MHESEDGSSSAHLLRRKIVKHLELQQRADASVALLIRDHILATNKQTLDLFVKLLDFYSPLRVLTNQEKDLFQKVSPTSSLESWLSLRLEQGRCKEQKRLFELKKQEAQKSYEENSPFGFISRWGKDSAGQSISLALKSRYDRLADELVILQDRLRECETQLESQAEIFMRAALEQTAVELLCSHESTIKAELNEILIEMSDAVNKLWISHAEAQTKSLTEDLMIMSDLLAHYRKVAPNLGLQAGKV